MNHSAIQILFQSLTIIELQTKIKSVTKSGLTQKLS